MLSDRSANDPSPDILRESFGAITNLVPAISYQVLFVVAAQPVAILLLDDSSIPTRVDFDGRDPCKDGKDVDALGRNDLEVRIERRYLCIYWCSVIIKVGDFFQVGPHPEVG